MKGNQCDRSAKFYRTSASLFPMHQSVLRWERKFKNGELFINNAKGSKPKVNDEYIQKKACKNS